MYKITQQNIVPPILESKFGQLAFMETYLWRQTPCTIIELHAASSSSNKSSHVTWIIASYKHHINSTPPRQNGRHLTANIFICIFVNEKFWILIEVSLKFVPKGPINNKLALVSIMAWHQNKVWKINSYFD